MGGGWEWARGAARYGAHGGSRVGPGGRRGGRGRGRGRQGRAVAAGDGGGGGSGGEVGGGGVGVDGGGGGGGGGAARRGSRLGSVEARPSLRSRPGLEAHLPPGVEAHPPGLAPGVEVHPPGLARVSRRIPPGQLTAAGGTDDVEVHLPGCKAVEAGARGAFPPGGASRARV